MKLSGSVLWYRIMLAPRGPCIPRTERNVNSDWLSFFRVELNPVRLRFAIKHELGVAVNAALLASVTEIPSCISFIHEEEK